MKNYSVQEGGLGISRPNIKFGNKADVVYRFFTSVKKLMNLKQNQRERLRRLCIRL